MSINQFLVLGTWGPRGETSVQMADRMLRSVEAFKAIDPSFGPWWVIDFVAKTGVPFEEARSRMVSLVEGAPTTDDDGVPVPGGGYSTTAASRDISGPKSVSFAVMGGDSSPYRRYPNSAFFETDYYYDPDPSIVTYPKFKAVTLAVISCWELAYARICSRDLMALWPSHRVPFEPCWMTYLSAPLASMIAPPPSIVTERTPDGGLLFIAAEETFDVRNNAHMKNARAISAALAPVSVTE